MDMEERRLEGFQEELAEEEFDEQGDLSLTTDEEAEDMYGEMEAPTTPAPAEPTPATPAAPKRPAPARKPARK
ncbi:MAG: hypothetical protein C4304_10000, partial [candidate division GAL15 bacterium]